MKIPARYVGHPDLHAFRCSRETCSHQYATIDRQWVAMLKLLGGPFCYICHRPMVPMDASTLEVWTDA